MVPEKLCIEITKILERMPLFLSWKDINAVVPLL